jgi:hypothetical protein
MDLPAAVALMDRVDALLSDVDGELGVQEILVPDAYVLWLFSRVRSTFRAARLLVSRQLIDEAMHLARSLVTDGLRLMKLESVGEDRPAYLLGWVNESITEKENLIREAVRIGLAPDPTTVLDGIRAQRQSLNRYVTRRGVGPLRRFASEKQLAEEFGLEREYWDFEYVNNIVHGSPLTASHRLQTRDDGVVLVSTLHDEQTMVGPTALISSQWALLALRSFRSMFTPPLAPNVQIDDLLAEIDAAAEQPAEQG